MISAASIISLIFIIQFGKHESFMLQEPYQDYLSIVYLQVRHFVYIFTIYFYVKISNFYFTAYDINKKNMSLTFLNLPLTT